MTKTFSMRAGVAAGLLALLGGLCVVVPGPHFVPALLAILVLGSAWGVRGAFLCFLIVVWQVYVNQTAPHPETSFREITFAVAGVAIFGVTAHLFRPRTTADHRTRITDVIASMTDAALVVDDDEIVRFANRRVARVLGYADGALTDTPFEELLMPGDRPLLNLCRGEFARNGYCEPRELRVFASDRTVRFVEFSASRLGPGADGSYRLYCLRDAQMRVNLSMRMNEMFQNMIEKYEIKQAAVNSLQRFEQLIDNFGDIILIATGERRIGFANRQVEETLGYRSFDLLGKNPFDFVHPDDVGRLTEAVAGLLAGKNRFLPVDVRLERRDGGYLKTVFTGSTVRSEKGETFVVLCFRETAAPDTDEKTNVLHGMLPLCSACRKIRTTDKNGNVVWQDIEKYLIEKTDIGFSHTFCPDCVRQIHPNG